MQFLTKFALKNTVALIIIVMLIAAGGWISANSLKVESMPDISFPVVLVTTTYPNASPADVLEDVTKPLESALNSTEGLKTLESYSNDNYSVIVLNLDSGTDADTVKEDVQNSVNEVSLPADAERPKVSTESFGSAPIYYLSIAKSDSNMSTESFDSLLEDTVIPELENVDGVEKVGTIGDEIQKVKIQPNLEVMNRYGISPTQLEQLINANHVGMPVGSVKMGEEDQAVRILSKYTNLEQIKRTKLFLPSGQAGGLSYVQLGDIANVTMDADEEFISRLNQTQAVSVRIYKKQDANEAETGDHINATLNDLKAKYPQLQFQTVYDTSVDIKKSINGMVREGLAGAVMASVMILLFLRNIRSTFVVLLSIPLSILVSLIVMSWMGITLNIMTLGGLAIAIGRVVDDSIVVIENIFRHLQMKKERDVEDIRFATKEVTNAITSSTLTTVAVFAPIGFVSGIVGEIFRPFAITVVCSLLASLIVAVTVIPLFTKILLLRSTHIKEHKPGKIANTYKHILEWSLNHKVITIVLAGVLFFGSLASAATLKSAMMPESDQKYMIVNITMPKATALETTDQVAQQVEGVFLKEPSLDFVESYIGTSFEGGSGSDNQVSYLASMMLKLNSDADMDAVAEKFRSETEPLMPAGAEIAINPLTGGGPIESFQIILNGADNARLREAAEIVKDKLEQNPEMTNINDNLSDTKSEVVISVDRDQAAEWGLSPMQVAGEVHNLIANSKISTISIDDTEYDMVLGLSEEDANSIDKINSILIKTPMGQQVRLDDIAKVTTEAAPAQIRQRDEQQYVLVSADITSADKGGVGQKATAEIQQLQLPDGVTVETGGVTQEIQNSFNEMFYAIGAAIFLVYIVMVIAFGNAMAPFAILLSLPLAAIGGLLALFITQLTLDMTSMIGFLMLIGIVVTNAIVLIDRVQHQRENGLSTREALIESGMTRLRPIIMTAVATIVALLPLGLGLSEGTVISQGLAVVVIGGLTTSTILTLVVVPVGYEVMDNIRTKVLKRRETRLQKKLLKQQAKHNVVG